MSYSGMQGQLNRTLCVALAGLLVVTQSLAAQQAPAPAQPPAPTQAAPAPAEPTPAGAQNPATVTPPAANQPVAQLPTEDSLKLLVLAGDKEYNDMGRRVMAPLVVQVLDRNDRPVEAADVVFRFPISGPGAAFAGGKTSETARTNAGGQAAALNWMANGQVGKFEVHVTASYGNQVGETTLTMYNVMRVTAAEQKDLNKTPSWWSHRWAKIAVIGGGAVLVGVIVYLATRGGGKGTPITINPGSPTVGAP